MFLNSYHCQNYNLQGISVLHRSWSPGSAPVSFSKALYCGKICFILDRLPFIVQCKDFVVFFLISLYTTKIKVFTSCLHEWSTFTLLSTRFYTWFLFSPNKDVTLTNPITTQKISRLSDLEWNFLFFFVTQEFKFLFVYST